MKFKQVLTAAAAGVLLAGCGGGGGATDLPTMQIGVAGLEVGKAVTLSLSGPIAKTLNVSASGVTTLADLPKGNYSLAVTNHPQRQLCRVVSGANTTAIEGTVTASVECHVNYLNDTGWVSSSPVAGTDAAFGRDRALQLGQGLSKVGSGPNGFDFSYVCADGSEAGSLGNQCKSESGSTEWACTRDNVTQLMWASKTVASLYTVGDVPADGWCGLAASAWDKPSIHELLSIVTSPRTDGVSTSADYFPSWGSNYAAKDVDASNGNVPWCLGFDSEGAVGSGCNPNTINVVYTAALPRSSVNADQFNLKASVGSNYVIVDGRRDLVWLFDTAEAEIRFDAAVNKVQTLNTAKVGGYTDWRLPNRNELDSLVDRSRTGPAVYPDLGALNNGNMSTYLSKTFWTNTQWTSSNIWRIDLDKGDIQPYGQFSTMASCPSADEAGKAYCAGAIYVRNRINTP